MTEAIFRQDNRSFHPSSKGGSPWADDLLHGGPAAGLLARAIERLCDEPELQVARLTIDLFRPVPLAALQVETRTRRSGRRIRALEASLLADGVEVARASGLLLRRSESGGRVSAALPLPQRPEQLQNEPLSGRDGPAGSGRDGFHRTIDVRWLTPPGSPGPALAWLRLTRNLVEGEELTPLVRLAASADFTNAVGSIGRQRTTPFINVDCSLYLQRLPAGEWIGFNVERSIEPVGVGVARATLYDLGGPVGQSTQALLANPMR